MNNKGRMLSSALVKTSSPPVMEAKRWISNLKINPKLDLMNLSQAAPIESPPIELIEHLKASLDLLSSHTYGSVLGTDELRTEVSQQWSKAYDANISMQQVAITSGCNQAFCAAVSLIATAGDKIILPVPWYFNHKMWLDIKGIEVIPLPCDENLEPDLDKIESLTDEKVKALVIVSPNNPTGKEYSNKTLSNCANYVKKNNLFLILDETYKDFRSNVERPHNLFKDPGWEQWLIHLYSFSKAYRLTGYRVGLMISDKKYLSHVEKFLDSVSICPNMVGQSAALFGLKKLNTFLSKERGKILNRQKHLLNCFSYINYWKIISTGAYFAYIEYEKSDNSAKIIEKLLTEASVLILPGSMFGPKEDLYLEKRFRVAFANIETNGITEFCNRLREIKWG